MKKEITDELLNDLKKGDRESGNKVIRNAIIKNGIQKVALNNERIINMQYTFSNEIKTGKITSQKRSGRCWMFAGLNIFREKISKDLNIKDFELSQVYPMFYDKLEKANYFLESIIRTLDEDIYSRIVMWLLDDPVQDGGQWDMFVNLIEKYGAVPKYAMPETFHSGETYHMNNILTRKLREYASVIRNEYAKGIKKEKIREIKIFLMQEFYFLLSCFLGSPPENFDFEYRDDDDKFHADRNLTPVDFYKKYIKQDLSGYISIINAPTPDKPFNKTYTIDFLGNVLGGKEIKYLNVESGMLKKYTLTQLKNNEPVWFGCDVGKYSDKDSGVMDTDIFLYDDALKTEFKLNKAERLMYGESKLTHAMIFTGVNIVKGKTGRWKVENSWGEEPGNKGFFVMDDRWFDEFNYQVVIHKKYLSEQHIKDAEQKPVILPPWDPMGSLAKVL